MDLITDWANKTKKQRQKSLLNLITYGGKGMSHDYIELVSAGGQGVYASTGPNFAYAVFGRDSIEVAEDLLGTHQNLVHTIIFTLARLQGVKDNYLTEEEPGKIHHEYRSRLFDGKPVSEESLAVMHKLQRWWGGSGSDEMIYYGSYDATPLYIRLIYSYCRLYGYDILSETYTTRNGHNRTLLDSLQAATTWLTAKIEQSNWKLLEYKRTNPDGVFNQVWKDSGTSYLHEDGRIANADGGIASVELQGYAYDALFSASQLLGKRRLARRLGRLARHIQETTLKQLWLPEQQFFAQGLDRDESGSTRQIKTLTSNAGLLLQTNLLSNLPVNIRRKYVEGIVQTICGPEFITAAGIRCRALKHKDIPGFADYHGTYAVWPKETYDIAKGLFRHSYPHLANQLNNRILHSVVTAGEFYEFFYAEDDGTIWYDANAAVRYFSQKSPDIHLPRPEPGQAWVISAVLSILAHKNKKPESVEPFEAHLVQALPKLHPLSSEN